MRKYNFLLGFILLFILLITPISIICAQELWSYDPSKDLPKNDPLNREWIITAVATSEDAIYTAVGLYREHLVLDEKREVILDDKGLYLMDRQSKLIFLNNKGEEIWSFKTQYAIENIRMSGNGEYIVVGTEEYSFNIDGYCEKVYVFNKSGTPLWTYDGGMFPYVDSSGNVIINTREGFEMYDIRKKLLWRHPNDDLHYIVASDELNLIAAGTAYVKDAAGGMFQVVSDASESLAATANSTNYVYLHSDNGANWLTISTLASVPNDAMLLATVVAGASTIISVTNVTPGMPSFVPPGVIVAWSGVLASIPSGWLLCDGNNGTPNLIDRFLQGITTAATNPGTTGGSHTKTVAGSWTFAGDTTTRVAGFTIDIRPKYYEVAWIMKA